MKKLLILTSLVLTSLVLTGCSDKQKLYILNWQEYIDESLIDKFEKEFNVKVVEENLISNELMYSSIQQGSAPYDVVFPSDYMIEKLSKENLLVELDQEKLTNKTAYTSGLDTLISNSGYEEYFVPYFWGSLGIMYNTTNPSVEADVLEKEWDIFFDTEMLSKYKIGMYDARRDSFAAAHLSLGKSINTYSDSDLTTAKDMLKNSSYNTWGDDNLKGLVAGNNLQAALVYSGDFFDQLYADDFAKDSYSFHAPMNNNVFFDAMCIPTSSKNVDLAHEFINFMIEEENAIQNASYVGYCPTFQSVYEAIVDDEEMDCFTAYSSWHPQNITYGVVYKDLGPTYDKMEELFNQLRVG